MTLLWKMIRALGRGMLGLLVFFGLSIAWTGILFFINPWLSVDSGSWPTQRPIIVGSGDSGKTRVILYRKLEDEKKADSSLVPWPLVPSGTAQDGRVSTQWKSVGGKAWQFEASWDDGDHILESRYRLEGETPFLVEARGRDPGLGFVGVILSFVTLLTWKMAQWWRRRRGKKPSAI